MPEPPRGFRREAFSRVIGSGPADFRQAADGLERWAAHRGSNVEVFPADAPLRAGTTVAIRTRQLGVWILAACRIESVVDEPTQRGFVYSTLPGHPECGYESLVVRLDGDAVIFDIEAVSKPGTALVRVAAPVALVLQRRAAAAYLSALHSFVRHDGCPRR